MWNYKAKVIRVVDGDTYDCLIDLGFSIFHLIRVRLKAVDTPEVFGKNASEAGKLASEFVKELIEGKDVTITTYKVTPTSYNRWEADVFIAMDPTQPRTSVGTLIVEAGHGVVVEKFL